MAGDTWTEARDAELTRLWLSGDLKGPQIGDKMGMTKSAIAGRVYRLQRRGLLPMRARSPAQPVTKQAPLPAGVLPPPKPAPKPAAIPKPRAVLPIGGARIRECQWVHGEPDRGPWRYCGCPAMPGKPYCGDHAAKAYRPKESAA